MSAVSSNDYKSIVYKSFIYVLIVPSESTKSLPIITSLAINSTSSNSASHLQLYNSEHSMLFIYPIIIIRRDYAR